MVQTRRKKAAAADGAVKENKATPAQSQTPKKARRGRPPKIRPEANKPTTSTEAKEEPNGKIDFESQDSCDSVITNEADSFLEKEEDEPVEEEKSKIPPPPPLSKRRSSAKLKVTPPKKSPEPVEEPAEEPAEQPQEPQEEQKIVHEVEEPPVEVKIEHEEEKIEQEPTVSSSFPPQDLNIPLPSRPEDSMEIADSSESDRDTPGEAMSSKEIHVDVEQGLPSWESKSDQMKSPPSRPRIHFLHPAFGSFDQPPLPPEPAPLKETENGFVIGFKPMALKSGKIGITSNPLAKTASPPPPTPDPESQQSKRSSNFGSTPSGSDIPPPQMVERPKLSFFNMPSTMPSVFSSDDDEKSPPKPLPVPPPIAAARIADAEEDRVRAAQARAEKAAQEVARRHTEERNEDQERRREERERRHKKAEEERAELSRQREEERRAREREREREAVRRQEREEARREEDRKQREEEQRAREEERRAREEGRRKEEERKVKEEEMRVPDYEVISECKFLIKSASKRRTESLVFRCECQHTGGNCSDGSCVNRAMNTECPSSCPAKCKNQRFAKRKYAAVEAFHTGTAKGCGLRALKDIKKGRFIIEYVGEVLEREDYQKRKIKYAADKKHTHHYLCDTGVYTIDATVYGNPSRFVNHSCDPNAVCERWSVPKTPGLVDRVGFFAKRLIKAGEEITFDYQFVNYGREAQQCFCGSSNCNGWIGQKLEFSSDEEEDDEDIVTTRHINMDEEEEEKLGELEHLAPHERVELIDDMLSDLVIRNKKHARKVITIASKMTDHAQRENLVKEIFSPDTSLGTQQYYAKEGMATLMSAWLYPHDYSLQNLKLAQLILQTLHNDVFVSCAKEHSDLQELVSRWSCPSSDGWVDLHVIASSLVTCVAEPEKVYAEVEEATNTEILANFNRARDMAIRLKHHWFNRSVSFRIPKKVRQPSPLPKENDEKAPEASRIASPPYQRHHSSSSYFERESHPRFFNNGNDVHQYRFGGYHGNNYLANYQKGPYRAFRDSHRDRRRFFRRSRSRSRSHSPQPYKRRRLDDREQRHRSSSPSSHPHSHYERRGSPDARSTESPERAEPKNIAPKEDAVKQEEGVVQQTYPYPHPAAAAGYPIPGYEAYGIYDPAMYMYHHPAAGYYPHYHPMAQVFAMETLPPNERLNELYERATLEQLMERLQNVERDVQTVQVHIARKRAEAAAAEAARRIAEEEARKEEAARTAKFVWAKATVAETGEVYYYNKVTKETQWSPPSAEQGLLDPSERASPDTTTATSDIQKEHLQSEAEATETNDAAAAVAADAVAAVEVVQAVVVETVPEVPAPVVVDAPTSSSHSNHSTSHRSSAHRERDNRGRERERERERERGSDRDRDRRESSHHQGYRRHHRHSSSGHRSSEVSERRIKQYKNDLDAVVRDVVKSCHREMRNATADKIQWLIRMVAKEMFKRESVAPGFDYKMSENAERKIRNYTKNLIERKLRSDDLWKGYSEH